MTFLVSLHVDNIGASLEYLSFTHSCTIDFSPNCIVTVNLVRNFDLLWICSRTSSAIAMVGLVYHRVHSIVYQVHDA